MVTDKKLEDHVVRVVDEYFNDVPPQAIPQLYLEKMYQSYSNIILLKNFDRYTNKWIRYDCSQSILEWYKTIRQNVCDVLIQYMYEFNERLPRDIMKDVFSINKLIPLLRWVLNYEVIYG